MSTENEFREYLERLGDQKAAKLFSVSERTAQSWRLGDRVPRPEQAKAIIAVTPLTYESIYGMPV